MFRALQALSAGQDLPLCPWCGAEDDHCRERSWGRGGSDNVKILRCGACKQFFKVKMELYAQFTSLRVQGPAYEPAVEYELSPDGTLVPLARG